MLADALAADYAEALAAMADDLNTPVALAAAYRGANGILGRHRQSPLSGASARTAQRFLDQVDALLGIVYAAEAPADPPENDALAEQVDALLVARTEARQSKDWARADAIRDELAALGVEVMDTPAGPTWRRLT